MTDFKNLDLTYKAIDSFASFNKTQKLVLKSLIKLNIDGVSVVSIKDLCSLSGVTNTPVSNALLKLEEEGVISDISRRGVVFTGCRVKESKISEIIERYKIKHQL